MKRQRFFFIIAVLAFACQAASSQKVSPPSGFHDFHFSSLAKTWDEAIPLGNGMIGALIWQKDSVLRMSLDRADLWDLRPIKEFEAPEFRFAWVVEQATRGNYKLAQEMGDVPYDRDAAPTKLPGAALEFPIPNMREVESVALRLRDAVCIVRWKNGITLESFVHATKQTGWFRIKGLNAELTPVLVAPPYADSGGSKTSGNSGPGGNDLRRLGYPAPRIIRSGNNIFFRQECWGGFSYTVHVSWSNLKDGTLAGSWEIQPSKPFPLVDATVKKKEMRDAASGSADAFAENLKTHAAWWDRFWARSSIHIPDTILEKQWYREMYKFGSASRRGAPPITLQAVWTADNSRLPPWKGDFHHDLNTQLSYWPCYSSNHLEEGLAFLDWLWWCKPVAERYTRTYFGTSGLNFAGVSTLSGEPMGGWIQYSLSPTVSAWLSQHFYLHWRYSLDRKFLRERAYPWIKAVAVHLEQLSVRDSLGRRKLPLSSSPEINDNRVDAWFQSMTNYDVALVRWLFGAAAELASELGLAKESSNWRKILSEWPELAVSETDGKLLVAPAVDLKASHRHFSHLMAIHPLGLLEWDKGTRDQRIISASLADLERLGPDWWCGYSYAWLGSMWARAHNGEKAAEALRTFATCFCLPNSFHVNGDQSGTGKSKFTYRPFTLEGNFACAQGIQEMLLQSQNGRLRLFPAIPDAWKDASYENLRAEGALLVSAIRSNGRVSSVKVISEHGGKIIMVDPFGGRAFTSKSRRVSNMTSNDGLIEFDCGVGGEIELVAR